jgi:TatA/E family protein of Tat protein translocase
VALIVFGPKKLPELGRTIGKGINELKRSMSGIRDQFDEEVKDIKDIKDEVEKGVDNLKMESLIDKGPFDFSVSDEKGEVKKEEDVRREEKEKGEVKKEEDVQREEKEKEADG